jgi:hypothetical protein
MSAQGWNNPGLRVRKTVTTLKALANAFSVTKAFVAFPQGCRKLNLGLKLANAFGVLEFGPYVK